MTQYYYSKPKMEEIANDLLRQFDAERLEIAKPIDVYAVIEKCLDVPYDWKILSPDRSILGFTVYTPGYYWVWEKQNNKASLIPKKVEYKQGTIVIESSLTEDSNRGRENFTVMHEVFHQVLHKDLFLGRNDISQHEARKVSMSYSPERNAWSSDKACEYQANFSAACFLMPRRPVTDMFRRLAPRGQYVFDTEPVIAEMAAAFSVSKLAMRYRLQKLELLN